MSAELPLCINCSGPVRNRYTRDGVPQCSISLLCTDRNYYFCTLRCAAQYGVMKANENPWTSRQATLKESDLTRRAKR